MKMSSFKSGTHKSSPTRRTAFTLIELLVVIVVVAVLAGMVLPVLAKSKARPQGAVCLNNLKQLAQAWNLYLSDSQGRICPNEVSDGTGPGWVRGVEDYSGSPNNYNIAFLLNKSNAYFAPYITIASVYKCPSDLSRASGRTGQPRMRSFSMSQAVGPNMQGTTAGQGLWLGGTDTSTGGYTVYVRESDMAKIGPANLWVLTEENPDSINDGAFAVQMVDLKRWVDWPAPLHTGASSVGFADGHVEMHKWLHPEGLRPVTYSSTIQAITTVNNNPDLAWIQARTSTK
jgi:prepilin-type N-terminal cleavage/methylation domain-containing protein/prepilin-type processing-associated H-X9-DG protein